MNMLSDFERDAPNPVDRHVGLRIRMRRKELGLSQERLAEMIGLTFQQVQKYERATNRVSASKLWEVARALNAPVSYFYEGLDDEIPEMTDGASAALQAFLLSNDGAELARLFPRIRQPKVRRRILDLVRAMAEETAPAEA
jgi:Predicted transcriptional regulators